MEPNCFKPQRFLIAHPFNPVYLLPLVELVKGKKTSQSCINKSKLFYQLIGMYPLILKKEVEGYLSDRLQEALWRESLHIINDNGVRVNKIYIKGLDTVRSNFPIA